MVDPPDCLAEWAPDAPHITISVAAGTANKQAGMQQGIGLLMQELIPLTAYSKQVSDHYCPTELSGPPAVDSRCQSLWQKSLEVAKIPPSYVYISFASTFDKEEDQSLAAALAQVRHAIPSIWHTGLIHAHLVLLAVTGRCPHWY